MEEIVYQSEKDIKVNSEKQTKKRRLICILFIALGSIIIGLLVLALIFSVENENELNDIKEELKEAKEERDELRSSQLVNSTIGPEGQDTSVDTSGEAYIKICSEMSSGSEIYMKWESHWMTEPTCNLSGPSIESEIVQPSGNKTINISTTQRMKYIFYLSCKNEGGREVVATTNVLMPLLISTCSELESVSSEATSQNLGLKNDINCTGYSYTTPLNRYSGLFDGFGYSIIGLTINSPGLDIGMMGYTKGAKIKNIRFLNSTLIGKDRVGVVVSVAHTTTFENVHIIGGSIQGEGSIGGIAGYSENNVVSKCSVDINITLIGTGGFLGGIAGEGWTDIIQSFTKGHYITNGIN